MVKKSLFSYDYDTEKIEEAFLFMQNLSENQWKAVNQQGNVLILAGPGTGKTHTLTQKILYNIQQGVQPENIFAVTFTNKAAWQLQERLEAVIGGKKSLPFIGTFHSWCYRILKNSGRNIHVLSKKQQLELLGRVCLKLQYTLSQKQQKEVLRLIGLAKNQMLPVSTIALAHETVSKIFAEYQNALMRENVCDFEDLILQTLALFHACPELKTTLQQKIRFLCIDEYQDTNEAQYQLIYSLVTPKTRICAIGDPDQAIYAFRGSNVQHFLRFEKDFPVTTTVYLEKNYRSSKRIVTLADHLIQYNLERKPKTLTTDNESGEEIWCYSFENEWKEAHFITKEIARLAGGTTMLEADNQSSSEQQIFHFADCAVLYRTKAQARIIEAVFKKTGLPYQLISSIPWYQQKEIQLLLQYVHDVLKPQNNPFFLTLDQKLEELKPSEVVKKIIAAMDLEKEFPEKQKNFMLFLSTVYRFDHQSCAEGLSALLDYYMVLQEHDAYDEKLQAVPLMTLHAAKGLEFPVVFISGLETGLLPLEKNNTEEERRLFYVGVTRAKKKLYLLHACKRNKKHAAPSIFIQNIENFIKQKQILSRKKVQSMNREQMTLW